MYFVEEKPLFPQEMSYLSIKFLKVPQSAILNLLSETKVPILDAQELMPLLLDILKMDPKQELDYHQELEKLFQETAEPQLESLPEEEETKSQS